MKMSGVVFLCLSASLSSCGGHVLTGPQADEPFDVAMDVGRSAFDLSHPGQARGQFEFAYGRALLRDDAIATRDAGYNLAVADLADDDSDAALMAIARTKRDMVLRGSAPTSALDTVAMAALCRQGRNSEALSLGRQIRTDDIAFRERAAFFTGLASDGLGDVVGIKHALAALSLVDRPGFMERADRAELESRLLVRQGLWKRGEDWALVAVSLRRDMLDYRGMARALDCASRAAQGAQQPSRAAAYAERAAASRANGAEKSRISFVSQEGRVLDAKGRQAPNREL